MVEKRFAGPGKFVWYELSTANVDEAVEFYGKLFGWEVKESYRDASGPYLTFQNHGREVGGVVPLGGDGGGESYWLPFVSVKDVEESTADAVTLKGKVLTPATPIVGLGELAVVEDPGGARLAVFAAGGPGEDDFEGPPRPGTFVWNDLLSRDPEESAAFYCSLLGWDPFTIDLGDQGSYLLLRRGELNEGGIIRKPQEAEGGSSWLPYVAVEDVSLSCMQALHGGGSVFVPPSDLHGAGTYAIIGDPRGALLALLQLAPPSEKA